MESGSKYRKTRVFDHGGFVVVGFIIFEGFQSIVNMYMIEFGSFEERRGTQLP